MRRFRATVAATAATAIALTGLMAAPAMAADPAELILSEVIEGSSNNKAVEIYNPTPAPIDLGAGAYRLQQFSNGAVTAGVTIELTGTIAPGGVHVIAHSSSNAAILAQADQTTGTGLFNGDDALALVKNATVIDVFGQIGVDPGTEWGTGLTSTADNTLQRKPAICVGDPNGADAFDPAVQWNGFAVDTFTGLGAHTTECSDVEPPVDPPAPVADCALDVSAISAVQGSGAASPVAGTTVRVEGTVVGDFQTGGFGGYYLQDAGDGIAATSDGIFVFAPNGDAVETGDVVHVVGVVKEFSGLTEIEAIDTAVCAEDAALPAPLEFSLPATDAQREAVEGMYVTLPQSLAILEFFEFGRFGTIDVGLDRQATPTAQFAPIDPAAAALAAQNLLERITIDDGRSSQNPDPAIHPNGEIFTLQNTFRGGDLVTDVTGVLDQRFGAYAIQPTQGAEFEVTNPRPDVPAVGGDLVVSSFNVLNYYTTIDPTPANSNDDDLTRGADTVEEFQRQEAKIVAALAEIDADVLGLIEIENVEDDAAVKAITAALNAKVGEGTYAYIPTGKIGTDSIKTALLYKPAAVTPVGAFALMNQEKDARWLDDRNRPGLTQTFQDADGAKFTVVVNHLKSKGSACTGDPEHPLQGNCNVTRTQAAAALADWLATDPTGQGTVGRELIIGDLNAYDKEDPIATLTAKGYTDLLLKYQGEDAYSYVFDGQLGYLDHALAGPGLLADVRGAAPWNINADEPSLIDYDMSFKLPAQDAQFAPDPFRSSDHDPVLVGLDLTPPDTTAPEIQAVAVPWFILAPNNKDHTVTVLVEASDDRGEVTVALTGVEASGSTRAEVTQLDDRRFEVKAVNGAIYTFTYTATDAAGNTATDTATVVVGIKGLKNLF